MTVNECPWCGYETYTGEGEITLYTNYPCTDKCKELYVSREQFLAKIEEEDEYCNLSSLRPYGIYEESFDDSGYCMFGDSD